MSDQSAGASRSSKTARRRLALWSCGVPVALGVVALAWIVVTGFMARAKLDHVKAELAQLRQAVSSGDLTTADRLGRAIENQTRDAHALTTGPAWWIAANIPHAGSPLRTLQVLTAQVDRIGHRALPSVLQLTATVSHASRPKSASIDLTSVAEALPSLRAAATTTHDAALHVAQAPASWLPAVSSARTSLLDQLGRLDDELTGAKQAISIALPMLGSTRPQRYFIGFLNDAEARGLGGVPGQFAITTVYHGQVRFVHFGTDDDLQGVHAKVNLGADFNARYKLDDPTGFFQNSDISPDFRDAAQIWAGMWKAKTGQRIDGALAIDPTALSYLLKVTGPATLPDGSKVSAANVVALTQQKQYALFNAYTPSAQARRKAYLGSLAQAVAKRLTTGGSPSGIVRAASRAAQERRFMVWSAQPAIEKQIIPSGWGGALVPTAGVPISGFVVTNGSGGKLDYYLHRSMTYSRSGCDASGRTYVTFTLHNAAPRKGLPAYVTTRKDEPPTGARPGDEQVIVTYYATAGAQISSVNIDNEPIIVATAPENGLVTATVSLELPAGATRTIALAVTGPAATSNALILKQPGVHPLKVHVDQPACTVGSQTATG